MVNKIIKPLFLSEDMSDSTAFKSIVYCNESQFINSSLVILCGDRWEDRNLYIVDESNIKLNKTEIEQNGLLVYTITTKLRSMSIIALDKWLVKGEWKEDFVNFLDEQQKKSITAIEFFKNDLIEKYKNRSDKNK